MTDSKEGRVCVWGLEYGRALGEPFAGHDAKVSAVRLTALDGHAITAGRDDRVRVWAL